MATDDATNSCGTALVAVDSPGSVRPYLEQYQHAAATGARPLTGSAKACAASGAVQVTGMQDDIHARLLAAQSPIAALVTSDTRTIAGLDGGWRNLGLAPSAQRRGV